MQLGSEEKYTHIVLYVRNYCEVAGGYVTNTYLRK